MTRKNRKKDENPGDYAMEATSDQPSSKLVAAVSATAAPHIVALPAPEEAIELVKAAMKADSKQNSIVNNETGNFPLLESSAKCANPRVYEAMRLKSGKVLPNTPVLTSKKLALPGNCEVLAPATLSELMQDDRDEELSLNVCLGDDLGANLLVEAAEVVSNTSSMRVESDRLPDNLDINFAVQVSGGNGLAGSESALNGLSSTLGSYLEANQVTLDGKNPVKLATMSESAVSSKAHVSATPSAGTGDVGVHVVGVKDHAAAGATETSGRTCPTPQRTLNEVDPVVVEVLNEHREDQSREANLHASVGVSSDKTLKDVASWVDMVRKNRVNNEEVVKLMDCVEGITEDAVFLGAEDLEDDSLERLCLIGIFPAKFPGREAVQKIVNSWPKRCRFNYHNSGWIVFVFEKEEDLSEVLHAGPYYAFGKPLLLKKMPPLFDFSKEACTSVPVWIQLPNLPLRLWKDKPLSKICSFLGSPQYTDKLTANKKVLSFARCLVEVDLKMNLPTAIPITFPDGKVLMQPVLYEDMPKFCSKCSRLGHNAVGHDNAKDDAPALYAMKNRRPEVRKTSPKKKKVVVEEPEDRSLNSGKTRHVQPANPRSGTETRAKGKEPARDCEEDGLEDAEEVQGVDLMAGTSGLGVSRGETRHVQNLSPDANPRSDSGTRAQGELGEASGDGAGLDVQEEAVSGSLGGGSNVFGVCMTESRHVPKTCHETCPRACTGSGACPDLDTFSDADANNSDTPLANTFSVLSPIQGRNWADEVDNEEIEDTPAPANKSKGKK